MFHSGSFLAIMQKLKKLIFDRHKRGVAAFSPHRNNTKKTVFASMPISATDQCLVVFGATGKGNSALQPLSLAGINSVDIIDERDGICLANSYSSDWQWHQASPVSFCWDAFERGSSWDIAICDGSAGTVDTLWENILPVVICITKRFIAARITSEFLKQYDCEPTKEGVVKFWFERHGGVISIIEMQTRGNPENGLFWVVFSGSGGVVNNEHSILTFNPKSLHQTSDAKHDINSTVRFYDQLSKYGCCNNDVCRIEINHSRRKFQAHDSTAVYRVYPSVAFSKIPEKRMQNFDHAGGIFDLTKYQDMDDVWAAARLSTSKKGNVNRLVAKAKKLNYFVKAFNPKNYAFDMHEINTSKSLRGGKEMRSSYTRSVMEMGGAVEELLPIEPVSCPIHYRMDFGVFESCGLRKVGNCKYTDRLVGYIHFMRVGNYAFYGRILGHGDHLNNGIMYLLHFSLVEQFLKNETGLQYIMYGGMFSRGRGQGLHQWKKRCLFEPKHLIYDAGGDWNARDGLSIL